MLFEQLSFTSTNPLTTDLSNPSILPGTDSEFRDGLDGSQYLSAAASSSLQNEVTIPGQIPSTNTLTNGGDTEIVYTPNSQSANQQFYAYNTSGNVNVSLTDLQQDIDLQLLDSGGIEVARSTNSGNSNEYINLADLPSDTYIVRVYTANNGPLTTYTLRSSNNTPPNLLARENVNIPNLTNTLNFSGVVSDQDTSDIFRFTLPNPGSFQVDLTQLSNNFASSSSLQIGVRIIQQLNTPGNKSGFIDSNEILNSNLEFTTTGLVFTTPNLPQGSYWIQLYQPFSNLPATRYSVRVTRLTSGSSQPSVPDTLPNLDLTELSTI